MNNQTALISRKGCSKLKKQKPISPNSSIQQKKKKIGRNPETYQSRKKQENTQNPTDLLAILQKLWPSIEEMEGLKYPIKELIFFWRRHCHLVYDCSNRPWLFCSFCCGLHFLGKRSRLQTEKGVGKKKMEERETDRGESGRNKKSPFHRIELFLIFSDKLVLFEGWGLSFALSLHFRSLT